MGIVVGKKSIVNHENQDGSDKMDYMLRYRFIDPSGLARERSANVGSDFWNRIFTGDSVVVHFAKAEPGVSRLDREQESDVVKFLARFSRRSAD